MRHRRTIRFALPAATLAIVALAAGFGIYALWQQGNGLEEPPTTVAGVVVTPAGLPPATAAIVTAPEPTTQAATALTTLRRPVAPLPFDATRAMEHIAALAVDIGVREAGSDAEDAAARYVAGCLEALGYEASIREFALPSGRVSHNVWAAAEGSSDHIIVLGAHLDTMPPSPGANDNGSGVAVLLELARDISDADLVPSVGFLFCGSEEVIDGDPTHHHYGSRWFVQTMAAQEQERLVGMISADMIAYGTDLLVRSMGRGPKELAQMLLDYAAEAGVAARYERDPGETGWSDHEAFEDAGYPVAWLERVSDWAHHEVGDTYDHCDATLVGLAGELLLGFLAQIGEPDLAVLAASRVTD